MTRDAFGPNLRRKRIQRGITLDQIAQSTKIGLELLEGLERNDFSGWPLGIYARAYIRQYAYAVGVDPDATVDEFCRWFPEGDRRAERTVREHAEIIGHDLSWRDEVPPAVGDERRGAAAASSSTARPAAQSHAMNALVSRLRRAFYRA
jgi:transcriptional regulator with XRE-family HTH domain